MTIAATSDQATKFTIVIYGSSLAGYAAGSVLSRSLGPRYKIIHVAPDETPVCAALYGNATGPSGYEFFRAIGLEEAELVTKTNTSFSFGTKFRDWPSPSESWVQCFSQPFSGVKDLAFDSVVNFHNRNLQNYLIAAQAAHAGKFAHPPGDAKNPLSRAEYGYHFAVEDIVSAVRSKNKQDNIEQIASSLRAVSTVDGEIESILLEDGRSISGDMFVDASGVERALISQLPSEFTPERSLSAAVGTAKSAQLGAPCRTVSAVENGWQCVTPLRGSNAYLRVTDTEDQNSDFEHESAFDFQTGALRKAWVGNCVGLGHASAVNEPLTPAPTTLLHRSLKKLAELIPTSREMTAEMREFNRVHSEDVANVSSFHRAHFLNVNAPQSAYWTDATKTPICDRLARKITQFENRGLLVQYDYEPFNPEDWSILHYGMGRRPRRGDVRLQSLEGSAQYLDAMSNAISTLVSRMPPHDQYMAKFKEYLEKKQHEYAT